MQVRTAAVVSLERYVPEIQENLRRSGFPKFTKSRIHEIRFEADAEPKSSTSDRFEFQTRDGRTGVVLMANALALHTNTYQHFEDFLSTFERALGLINPVLSIEFAERLGIRYVDLVRLADGERFDQYMTGGILGPDPSSFGMARALSRFEMLGPTDVGTLALRQWQMSNGNFLPPDLLPSTLNHPTSLAADEVVSLLDLDHYAERQFDFELNEIKNLAWQLHDNLDRAFRGVVTEFALEKWGSSTVQG
jgi:uncharacterized protein (TIGR04255 family)